MGKVAEAVSGVAGGLMGGSAADKGRADVEAAGQAAAQQADPFMAYRAKYAKKMDRFMKDPGKIIRKDPSYRFRFKQGQQALERGATKGFLNSGRLGLALTEYGQEFATQEYDKVFERLGRLSGATTGNLGAASAATMGAAESSAGLRMHAADQRAGAVAAGAPMVFGGPQDALAMLGGGGFF